VSATSLSILCTTGIVSLAAPLFVTRTALRPTQSGFAGESGTGALGITLFAETTEGSMETAEMTCKNIFPSHGLGSLSTFGNPTSLLRAMLGTQP